MAKITKHINDKLFTEEKKLPHQTVWPLRDIVGWILFQNDPLEVNMGENLREYHPEAEAVTMQLDQCESVTDVMLLVDTVLSSWFFKDWGTVKTSSSKQEQLTQMGTQIWSAWVKCR